MRKNLLLTLWLLLPLAVVGALFWWVFQSLGRQPAMEAAAVGAGAGDAGGAKAVGQWLAGRADGELVDPRAWPGGVEVLLPAPAVGEVGRSGAVTALSIAADRATGHRTWAMQRRGDHYTLRLSPEEAARFDVFFAAPGAEICAEVGAEEPGATDANGRPLRALTLPPTPPGRTARSEPLVVMVECDSVYATTEP